MKVGIVIQGKVDNLFILQKSIEYLSKSFSKEDIVISTWDEQGKLRKEQDAFSDKDGNIFGIKTIRTSTEMTKKYGESFNAINVNNIIYQSLSTLMGIQHFKGYTHIIKMRSDEFYEKMDLFSDKVKSDDRMHFSSLFSRNDFPFHIGDHVVGGRAEDMTTMFGGMVNYTYELLTSKGGRKFYTEWLDRKWNRSIFNNTQGDVSKLYPLTWSDICPEVKLTINYLTLKESKPPVVKQQVELMNKHFCSFDVRDFGKFYFCANSVGKGTIITDSNVDKSGRITNVEADYNCQHEPWIICPDEISNSLISTLIDAELRNNSDLKDLDSDYDIYCKMYHPYKVHRNYMHKTKVQASKG